MEKSQLTVVPIGGLGNRMRVIASIVAVAPQIEGKIHIVWQSMRNCRARFDELFQPLEDKYVILDAGSFGDSPATKKNLWLPCIYRKFVYNKEFRYFYPTTGKVDLVAMIKQYTSIYLASCYDMFDYAPEIIQKCFFPLPLLEEKINEVVQKYSCKTLGVHVRRTDNIYSIRFSPLTAFRKRIDELLKTGEIDSIFLCTDNEDVRSYFREIYGERVITRSIKVNRNTLQGIQDAVIDLWCLSKTSRILGSFYSSFSDMAAMLGGTLLEIIKNDSPSN